MSLIEKIKEYFAKPEISIISVEEYNGRFHQESTKGIELKLNNGTFAIIQELPLYLIT